MQKSLRMLILSHRKTSTLVLTACLSIPVMAQSPWRSTLVTNHRKDRPTYYNSQRLALDGRGRPHVIYVKRAGAVDTLFWARRTGANWQREKVFVMNHSGKNISGISAFAIALDRREQPHVFIYSSNYTGSDSVFEERWVFRQRRGWRHKVIRRSVNSMGGAAMHDPHLAIDGFGRLHVVAYVHTGYGPSHRAMHRFFNGNQFQIELIPKAPGKKNSGPSNLFIDRRNVMHVVYDSKLALRRGNAEPGYPDSGLFYVSKRGTKWSNPQTIRQRVGPDSNDTKYYVLSNGITVDRRGNIHITYAISKRKRGDPADVFYVRGRNDNWQEEHVATVSPQEGSVRVSLRRPMLDRRADPHVAFDTTGGTRYARRENGQWLVEEIDGTLEGFALAENQTAHLLTSRGTELVHRVRQLR